MPFCKKCGTAVDAGAQFCPQCGEMQDAMPVDNTGVLHQMDASANKGMAILSYFGLLVLIPIFAAKRSPFARFHANQGLVCFLFEVVYSIVKGVLENILVAVFFLTPWLATLLSAVLELASLVFLALSIIGIVNAAKGEMKELPVIGKIRLLK